MSSRPEDPLLRSARREALTVVGIWALTTIYCVSFCYLYGYAHTPDALPEMAANVQFVLGFPSWVFWGLIVPWFACLGISAWFAFYWMEDTPLGEDETAVEGSDA